MTPLHDLEALASIAEGPPGPARDWANAHLAILAPDRYRHLPAEAPAAMIAMVAAPPRLAQSVADGLSEGRSAARVAAAMPSAGLSLEPLRDPLRAAIRGDGDERDLWIGLALASAGALDDASFAAAARAAQASPLVTWALPVLVLRHAGADRLEEAAEAIARALAPRLDATPSLLWSVLCNLGAPPFPELRASDPDVVARLVGGDAVGPAPRGSRRRRAAKWVQQLLAGVDGPAAALVRALCRVGHDPRSDVVAAAAWLADPPRGPALACVLEGRAGWDRPVLAEARATVTDAAAPAIVTALTELAVAGGITPLAVALRSGSHGAALAHATIERFLESGPDDTLGEACAAVMASHAPERVVALLREPATRPAGLVLAEWLPTEEVLAILLELPLPAAPDARWQYARALASMGDASTAPLLSALAREDDASLADSIALAESILGQPLR